MSQEPQPLVSSDETKATGGLTTATGEQRESERSQSGKGATGLSRYSMAELANRTNKSEVHRPSSPHDATRNANTFSRVKASAAKAFRVSSLSLVTA